MQERIVRVKLKLIQTWLSGIDYQVGLVELEMRAILKLLGMTLKSQLATWKSVTTTKWKFLLATVDSWRSFEMETPAEDVDCWLPVRVFYVNCQAPLGVLMPKTPLGVVDSQWVFSWRSEGSYSQRV